MNIALLELDEKTEHILREVEQKEHKSLRDILKDAIENYIDQYEETLELLSDPDFADAIRKGRAEVDKNVKGVLLDDLED